MPQSRPIMADVNSESSRISQYIDYFLQSLANAREAYIKVTYHFIHFITNQTLATDCFLVRGDATSLYTNMFTETAINKVQQAFHDNPNDDRPSDLNLQLLRIICNGNDFKYNGTFTNNTEVLQWVNASHPASPISTC